MTKGTIATVRLIDAAKLDAVDVSGGGTLFLSDDGTYKIPDGAVASVNGQTGVVVLDTDDVSEGATNKYYATSLFNTDFATKTQDDLGDGATYKQYNPASVAITGGSITGITDLAIADGGTGASTATAAINNLLPSQSGEAGKFLKTDGANVSWQSTSGVSWGDSIQGTTGTGFEVNVYGVTTQATANSVGIFIGDNFNSSSIFDWNAIKIVNESNTNTGRNTGVVVENISSDFVLSGGNILGVGISISQRASNGTAFAVFGSSNIGTTTNGLANFSIDNTQSVASVVHKIDMGTSAQAHIGTEYDGSTSARVWNIATNLTTTSAPVATTTRYINMQIAGVDYRVKAESVA